MDKGSRHFLGLWGSLEKCLIISSTGRKKQNNMFSNVYFHQNEKEMSILFRLGLY